MREENESERQNEELEQAHTPVLSADHESSEFDRFVGSEIALQSPPEEGWTPGGKEGPDSIVNGGCLSPQGN